MDDGENSWMRRSMVMVEERIFVFESARISVIGAETMSLGPTGVSGVRREYRSNGAPCLEYAVS